MIKRRLQIVSASLLGTCVALSACASGNDLPDPDVAASLNNLALLYVSRRVIFKQNRATALAEWRELAA